MKNILSRWFGGPAVQHGMRRWAESQGLRFAPSRGGEGFVIESEPGAYSWRAEWGPSQREYLGGQELRVRQDIGEAGDLQMLIVTKQLAALLEQQVFEGYTEGTQTVMDDTTPEEMRWLVMFPKVPRSVLAGLSDRFTLIANRGAAAPLWLEGALAKQLEAASSWIQPDTALAMVVQRSRFVLRMECTEPTPERLQAAVALAGVAAASARRVGEELMAGRLSSQRPSTWGPASAMPGAETG
jgi:hypothetical protein